jgi:archaellum component FlaF (FlaF/FlaG flagellin family)
VGDIIISPAALVAITSLLVSLSTVVGILYRSMIAQYEARLKERQDSIDRLENRLDRATRIAEYGTAAADRATRVAERRVEGLSDER